jgi:ABC-type spermidine/putrescine transport system permease subunit I
MGLKRRRRIDLFSVLVAAATIGMTLTVGYQISLYYSDQSRSMAERQLIPPNGIGG